MRNKLFFIFVGLLGYFPVSSQTLQREVLNTAGKTNSSSTLILTNNIGETAINTYQNGFTLREGFLQPDDSVSIFAQIFHVGNLMFCANDSVKLYSNTGNGFVYQWFFNGLMIPGANDSIFYAKNTGSYKVRISVGNNYSFSFEKIVIARALPQLTLQYSRSQFCQGDSVNISGTGAKFYQWNNGITSNSIMVKQTGIFSFIGTDSFGCSNLSPQVSITVNQPIVPIVNANGPTIVCNSNVGLFATNAVRYNWNTGATSSNIMATTSGNYWVVTTDSNGCSAKSNEITIKKYSMVPDRPAPISGEVNPCSALGTGLPLTYSTNVDTNVMYYSWVLNNGMNSIGRIDSHVIQVLYPAGFTSGQIRVTPINACGSGIARVINPKTILNTTLPIVTQSVMSVCSIIGTNNRATYSIQPISGCNSYQWTVPANSTLVSGQGSTSIQVIFASNYIGGKISVFGISNCGNTPQRDLDIKLLSKPIVTGPPSICPGNSATYAVSIVPNATLYRFNLLSGLSIISQNANSAIITNTGSFISGNLGVQVFTSNCGFSQPGTISLTTAACRTNSNTPTLSIFPNPNRGKFQLSFNSGMKNVQVSLYSSDGRLIKRHEYASIETQNINYQDISVGFYYLEVIGKTMNGEDFWQAEKIMVQR